MPHAVAIAGPAGSGKDTVADLIAQLAKGPVVRLSWAAPIKRLLAQCLGVPHEHLHGPSQLRQAPVPRIDWTDAQHWLRLHGRDWAQRLFDPGDVPYATAALDKWLADLRRCEQTKGAITTRLAAQTIPGRDLDTDVWVREGLRTMASLAEAKPTPQVIVISDTRYVNEMRVIAAMAKGQVWYVHRPIAHAATGLGERAAHSSETECRSTEAFGLYTRVLQNTGTLGELRDLVRAALVGKTV